MSLGTVPSLALEEVSSVLNTGEVPNLYSSEDKMEILELCSKSANAAGAVTPNDVFAWYVANCRKNLHITLALSPIGSDFRVRLRNFPSLVNCCTIDWFKPWPPDALESVAVRFLTEVDLDDAIRPAINQMCTTFHTTVMELSTAFTAELKRYNYVTPTSYLQLISSFKQMLGKVRKDLSTRKKRYINGLEKLADAVELIALVVEVHT